MKKLLFILFFTYISAAVFGFMVQPLIQTIQANPNEEKEIEFILSNTTNSPETVSIITKGVYIDPAGKGWIYDDSYERSFVSWVTMPNELRILPGEKSIQKFKVKVPSNAAGSYFASFTFTSASPITTGQVAYRINYVGVVQLIVSGQGNKEKTFVNSSKADLVKEAEELKGIRLELEISNPSDWIASVWGRIDIKSDSMKKIVASLIIDQNDSEFVSPKKTRTLVFNIDRVIPPGTYQVQFAMDYGYQDFYKGKTNFQTELIVPAEIEQSRKTLLLSTDPKELYVKIEKRASSRGIQVNPVNTNVLIVNSDYVDATVTPSLVNDFSGFTGVEGYSRLMDSKYVTLRTTKDILSRAFASSSSPVTLTFDYRRATLDSLKGEYYGYLNLDASGKLSEKTLVKNIQLPIIVDFGENNYTMTVTGKDATLSEDKTVAHISLKLKNEGNSRIKYDMLVYKFNSQTNQMVGESTKPYQNVYIYPDTEVTINYDLALEENADKITVQIIHTMGTDTAGNPITKQESIDFKVK